MTLLAHRRHGNKVRILMLYKFQVYSGSVLKVLTILPVTLMTQTITYKYFDFGTIPSIHQIPHDNITFPL